MSMERTTVLLRPSLRFITKLPTIKIDEFIDKDNRKVIWRIKTEKPVYILGKQVFSFYIDSVTMPRYSKEKGWQYDLAISIRKNCFTDPIIPFFDESYYLNTTWWTWG